MPISLFTAFPSVFMTPSSPFNAAGLISPSTAPGEVHLMPVSPTSQPVNVVLTSPTVFRPVYLPLPDRPSHSTLVPDSVSSTTGSAPSASSSIRIGHSTGGFGSPVSAYFLLAFSSYSFVFHGLSSLLLRGVLSKVAQRQPRLLRLPLPYLPNTPLVLHSVLQRCTFWSRAPVCSAPWW